MTPIISAAFVTLTCSVLILHAGIARGLPLKRSLADEGDDDSPAWTYHRTATDEQEPYGASDWHIGYPDCGLFSQSPINLSADVETVAKSSRYNIEFYPNECSSDELVYEVNEYAWKVSFDGCSDTPHLDFEGEAYNLAQMHIHSPSEHMIGGAEHDAEIHFVHIKEGTEDDLLVVGVLFDTTEYGTNIEIQYLWDVLKIGETETSDQVITRVYNLLPSIPAFSHYMGSLTNPPCTEGVKWIVMSNAVLMSKLQLDEFRISVASYEDSKVNEQGNTNRPVQPLNERNVFFVRA